jgi:hypothetical protein
VKYKHFCEVYCINRCYKTIVSRMTALNDILSTSLVFLNHLVFCLWQNMLYPLKGVISDLTSQLTTYHKLPQLTTDYHNLPQIYCFVCLVYQCLWLFIKNTKIFWNIIMLVSWRNLLWKCGLGIFVLSCWPCWAVESTVMSFWLARTARTNVELWWTQ